MYRDGFAIELRELGKTIRFVDRVEELEFLRKLSEEGYVFPIAIYGPEGCGKTTLLKYFVWSLSRARDVVAIYVDALEEKDISRSLFSPHIPSWDAIEELISSLPIGREIARSIMYIVKLLSKRYMFKGKKLVIVLDDVYRAIGLENVDRYTKMLYEWIEYLHRELDIDRVAIVLTTSEGISKRELYRHTYVHVYMIWNLPRRGFEELVEQLNPPKTIDIEELWRSTGGNPRALIELARFGWSTERWFRYIENKVVNLVEGLDIEKLKRVVEDPDSDPEIARELEERNLMICLNRVMVIGRVPDPDPELGIGGRWAWQLPIYREAIRRLLR